MNLENNKNQYSVIILAAGKGTRMKNDTPKLMHKIAGEHIIFYPIDLAKQMGAAEIAAVINTENHDLNNYITSYGIKTFVQKEQLGTAHAVKCAADHMDLHSKYTVILYGDTPLITTSTILEGINQLNHDNSASAMVFGFIMNSPNHYGKLKIDGKYVTDIIEYFEDKNSQIPYCNSGIIIIESKYLKDALSQIQNNNAKKEYYLTDIIKILNNMKRNSLYYIGEMEEFIGVNSQEERNIVDSVMQKRIVSRLFDRGVTIYKPETSYFEYDIDIESGANIEPNVYIGKGTIIEKGALVRSFSYLEDCKIGKNAVVGPFARVRTKTILHKNVRLGSFVESKNAEIKENSKANHLSYLGDIKIGKNVNIGAGTIICNYDGISKHTSKIEDNVFVGSNTSIISPVNIGRDSIIGAGSVVTKDVQEDSIVITRAPENHLKNKAKLFKEVKKRKTAK